MQFPSFLVNRDPDTAKWDYGHALLVAGSYGKMGCAVLAAKASMRIGAGLVTVHVPQKGVDVLQTAFPEAMLSIDADEAFFTRAPEHINKYAAVAIGPGIGTHPQSVAAMKSLLQSVPETTSLIIDADALNILARERNEMLPLLSRNTILTPHAREFDRLSGCVVSNNEERLKIAEQLAKDWKVTILLKGHSTMVVDENGDKTFITRGNAGMATAGSGDVLTGILLGLASQNAVIASDLRLNAQKLASLGGQIHAISGEIGAGKQGEFSIIATDLIENLRYVTM